MTDNNDKITYKKFQLDAQVGTIEDQDEIPLVDLSWSDNKGVSYGNAVSQSLGRTGEYTTVPAWSRLGLARDRVFKVSSSANALTAINGAFIEIAKATS